MKKILQYLAVAAVAALFFVSCSPEKEFNKAFLYGKWQSGTLYEVYKSDGTGHSWDESDPDITEADAQDFLWTLTGETLTRNECMETIGCEALPYDYTVSDLTESKLVYRSRSGKTYTFTKVSN